MDANGPREVIRARFGSRLQWINVKILQFSSDNRS